jgi:CCR4-NOT transcriptional regulation complex NOT5 subunit
MSATRVNNTHFGTWNDKRVVVSWSESISGLFVLDPPRPKHYQPKNPYPTPSYYPQAPLSGLFDNAAMFEKFDIDTLFFIFYYQQGTYQQ